MQTEMESLCNDDRWLPEGYTMVLGDFFVADSVSISQREKIAKESIVKIQFVDAENNDEVVAGGDYFVDGDGDGIFHTREIQSGYRKDMSYRKLEISR